MPQKVLQYVEIDVDYCSLTYSQSPCMARLIQPLPSTTKLLLHFEEGAGNNPVDSSPSAHGPITLNGAAAIVTGGGGSMAGAILGPPNAGLLQLTAAGSSFCFYANSTDWEFGNGDFTIDWWEWRLDTADNRMITARGPSNAGGSGLGGFMAFLVGYSVSGRLACYSSSNGSAWDILSALDMGSLVANVWSHRALVRKGNTFYTFKDGVLQTTATSSATLLASTQQLMIGAWTSSGTTFYYNGFIDEFRITKGLGRWTSNFNPVDATDFVQSGTAKCFNTRVTCQDIQNFSNVPATLRFAVPTADLPNSIDSIPSIKDIQFDPAVISLGENLGERATLTVHFDDHRHSDSGAGGDKYLSTRSYDSYSQGTFWGKFRARQPYLRGRNLRWITGFVGQALADMETRHYVIDSFSGPTNDGVFEIVAKDILKLADGDRAQAPVANTGFLTSSITNTATSFTVSPAGIGSIEYPASGYIAIGGAEICNFSRSGDTFTIGRGQFNTPVAAHNAQDRVQNVLVYSAQGPDVIIADLLQNYAGISSSFIPSTDWHTEVSTYLNRLYTAVIPQPTSVNDLISELIEQAGLSMWWDDRAQKIGLLVLRGLIYTNYLFDENTTLADTFEVEEQPDLRLTEVDTYFGQINSLTSLTDKANYRSVSVIRNTAAEANYGSAAIKEIFSRWIPAGGRTIADRIGAIQLSRFVDPPRHVKVSVLRGSTPEIQLARGYQVASKFLQDQFGAPALVNTQVTKLNPTADLIEIEMDEVLFTAPAEDLTHRQIVIDSAIQNINLRSIHDSLYPTPDASITVIVTINSGVIVSSAAASLVTIDVGSWPTGVTIIVAINGDVRGAGGNGGAWNGNGNAGGTALFTRFPIKLASTGTLWGGGGGGGGSTYGGQASGSNLPGGAGGGAGIVAGVGGAGFGGGNGANGTDTAGGGPGGPFPFSGTGGSPGAAGGNGFAGTIGGVFYSGFSGGAAGFSIDGVSFVTTGTWNGITFTGGALGGSLAGPTVN